VTSYRGSRGQASGQPEPPAVREGFPTPATAADTRPVGWDVGPGALRRTELRVTVEHSPTTYVLLRLCSCTFPFPSPGSLSRLCSEFCLWSSCSVDFRWPTSLLPT